MDHSAQRPTAAEPPELAEPLDAMRAAPDHLILLENDQVRVLDTHLRQGDRTPLHTHRWPAVLYVLGWSDFVRRDAAGAVLLDSRTRGSAPAAGSALWSEPLRPHWVENVGSGELRVIAIELKQSR